MKKITLIFIICLIFMNYSKISSFNFAKKPVNQEPSQSESNAQADEESSSDTAGLKSEIPSDAKSYDKGTNITLMYDGKVHTLSMYDYLYGVLCGEMPAGFPIEAIKAQAVAARTYTLNKLYMYEKGAKPHESHKGAQMCGNYEHCKAFSSKSAQEMWGKDADFYESKLRKAIMDTDGQYVSYENQPIVAVFHSASGPKTENASDVWGGEYPYLVSSYSPGGEDSPKYKGEVVVKSTELIKKIQEATGKKFELKDGYWIGEIKRSEGGGVLTIVIGGNTFKGTEIRKIFKLNSTNFTISYKDGSFIFSTIGYGHGVGMSQYGAKALAIDGKNYEEILSFYYKDTKISKMN